MNTPKAIELALTNAIRAHAELTPGTLIRPWQSLGIEGAFVKGNDRTFPCIDIRCSPDQWDENQATLMCQCEITAMSRHEDDPDHADVSTLFEGAHGVTLSIFNGFMGRVAATLYDQFRAAVEAGAPNIDVGGVTLPAGLPPSLDEAKHNQIGIGFAVHFSYKREA
jgi:hypothetical protein